MTERPTWDEYFIGMAQAARTRADCTRAQVGAVVVHPIGGIPMLIRAGYNGPRPVCRDARAREHARAAG